VVRRKGDGTWFDAKATEIPPSALPLFEGLCLEKSGNVGPQVINAWASSATSELIATMVHWEESGTGFAAGAVGSVAFLEARVQTPLSQEQGFGALYHSGVGNDVDVAQPYAGYRYYKNDAGVEGVAVPIAGSNLTFYVFTSANRFTLQSFERTIGQTTWHQVQQQFSSANGSVFGGPSFRSAVYMQMLGARSPPVQTFGGLAFNGISQQGAALVAGDGLKVAVTSDVVIDNPGCCADAAPLIWPEKTFQIQLAAPAFAVLEDGPA
jgi:hypothetical protein